MSEFQSTPSGRKATEMFAEQDADFIVSIHAFREEGDRANVNNYGAQLLFQSTPSGRKATLSPRPRKKRPRKFQSTPSGRKATSILASIPIS